MQPQRTATGYRIEPARLVECLHYLYYWLPKEQWWHHYGDGRKYGKNNYNPILTFDKLTKSLLNFPKIEMKYS